MRTRRGGFSLIEAIVAIAIMMILAGTLTPTVLGLLDKQRIDKGAASLEDLRRAIEQFQAHVANYPLRLGHLAEDIVNSDQNSCQTNYAGAAGNWEGPYVTRLIPPTGVPVPLGVARDTLVRDPPTTGGGSGNTGVLQIIVENVTEEDVLALDELVDGDGDANAGVIRWDPADASGFVVLRYSIGISGC